MRKVAVKEKRAGCPECGEAIGSADQTCQKCGAALSYVPGEADVCCAVCESAMSAYAESCPECGETGYPALRPRKGRKWKGSKPEGLPREASGSDAAAGGSGAS